jgi:hypothetical protein
MFNFLNRFTVRPSNPGAILPSQEEMQTVNEFKEIVASANSVTWKPLDTSRLPEYGLYNQDGSSSCVMATLALMCSILYFLRTGQWVRFSFWWFYTQRRNKPGLGSIATDAFKIWKEKGALPDEFMPSDNKSETEVNKPIPYEWLKNVAQSFMGSEPIYLPIKDIDTVASVIQTTGKPVMVWFRFSNAEWSAVPAVLGTSAPSCHSVTAIPPNGDTTMTFGLYEGEKAIVIQDSWGKYLNTFNGKRIIKESYFKNRNVLAAYVMNFKFDTIAAKPLYDGSVKSLQDCLKYEGFFPTNVDSTGYFGNITKDAVIKFQRKYGIDPIGIVGPITKKKLTELFS